MTTKNKTKAKTSKKRVRYNRQYAVKIAKDVLAQIKAKRFVAESGTYCRPESPIADNMGLHEYERYENSDFKQAFKNGVVTECNVCALGSLFTAMVADKNSMSVRDMHDVGFSGIISSNKLGKYFTAKELCLMEYVFELGNAGEIENRGYGAYWIECMSQDTLNASCYQFGDGTYHPATELKAALRFGNKYSNDENRLKAIMNNIIKNKGHFVI